MVRENKTGVLSVDILEKIHIYAQTSPDRPAYLFYREDCGKDPEVLTYRQLEEQSDLLAQYLVNRIGDGQSDAPLVVYGHKDPGMIVAFAACMKAGHAYCPVDTSMPADRIDRIIEAVDGPVILCTEDEFLATSQAEKISDRIVSVKDIPGQGQMKRPASFRGLKDSDTMYIIFTSGSTGRPKGVEISYGALNNYLDWACGIGGSAEKKEGLRFLDQAPFSFDLSVMDTYVSLACGGTLCPVDKKTQGDYGKLYETLRKISPQVWVSTPSFADVCLADPSFSEEMLPQLELIQFCGERLTNKTAERLLERFPKAEIWNTYGPTESTVAMTGVQVTKELCEEYNPLPVGRVKPGSGVYISDESGRLMKDGENGEILITGNTLSSGYYKSSEQTEKAFRQLEAEEESVLAYHTGDEGYLVDGMLFYNGRIDLQVKLHGYRIELGDIENNLMRLPGVSQAVVLANQKDGKVVSLTGVVCLTSEEGNNFCADLETMDEKERSKKQRALSKQLKEQLKDLLPEYMVPKKITAVPEIPMTVNGKADRRKLQEMLT